MKVEIIIKPEDLTIQAEIVKILKKLLDTPNFYKKFEYEVKVVEWKK